MCRPFSTPPLSNLYYCFTLDFGPTDGFTLGDATRAPQTRTEHLLITG